MDTASIHLQTFVNNNSSSTLFGARLVEFEINKRYSGKQLEHYRLYKPGFDCSYFESGRDISIIEFNLNGIFYSAVENPSDGYRSSLYGLFRNDELSKYSDEISFPVPLKVEVSFLESYATTLEEDYFKESEIVRFSYNKKTVMDIGTHNIDDYYPLCVLHLYKDHIPQEYIPKRVRPQIEVVDKFDFF